MARLSIKKTVCLLSMLVLCVANAFSQSVVDLGTGLWSTKYYESKNSSNPPANDWYAVDFDDSEWKSYTDPMAFPVSDAFWIRRTFVITDEPALHNFQLKLAHNDESKIYINGQLFHNCGGCGRYCYYGIPNDYFVVGTNVLSVYVYDSGAGSQYLECFLSTTDGSDIIMDLPQQPTFLLSASDIRLYLIDGRDEQNVNAHMITPTGKVDAEITWTSANQDIVTVADGKLKGVSAGTTVVTATTTYGGSEYKQECTVEVRAFDPKSKIVNVETPGTLGTLLSVEEQENIDNLTLIGKLNGSDIQVLRYMAGRNERGNRSAGMLSDLDLSNVEFVTEGNGSYKISNNDTRYIETGKLPNNIFRNCSVLNTIVLPESVTSIGSEAFRECTNLEHVDFSTNITFIDSYAFYNCSNLKSIEIPSTVTSLGYESFGQCKKLENVTFGNDSKLVEISGWALYQTGLKSITIPASVETIGDYAFYYCNSLNTVGFEEGSHLSEIKNNAFYNSAISSIEIPEGCLEIGECGFESCRNLSRVSIPSTLVSIEREAFRYCSNLVEIRIPEDSKLTAIEENAFDGTGITSLYIPKGLFSISNIFSNASQLQSLTVHPDNKYYEAIGGIVYSKRDKSVVLVPKSIEGYLTFPDYVTSIPDNLLQGCSKLKGVVLNSEIASLGNSVFSGCSNIQLLMSMAPTPATLTNASFDGINMENIALIVPQGSLDAYTQADGWKNFSTIEEVGNEPKILMSASNIILYDVTYESARKSTVTVTVISKDGISDVPVTWSTSDANVATVTNGVIEYAGQGTATITASVTIDDYTATTSCTVTSVGMTEGKLVYVVQAGTLSTLLSDKDKDDLTHLIVMGNLNGDDFRVLRYMAGRDEYENLTVGSLEILDMSKARIVSGGEGYLNKDNWWRNVSSDRLGQDIFRSCNSLKKVILPQTLYYIDSYAFYGCANLEEVVIPDGVTNVGYESFRECRKLTTINFPSSITSIEGWLFYGCTSLKSVDMSSMTGITSIPSYLFYQSGINHVRLSSTVVNISNDVFRDTPLKSIEFGSNSKLQTIGSNAFYSTQLKSITIPASVKTIGNDAFGNCDQLASVLYEENNNLNAIGDNAFNSCPIRTFIIPKKLISLGCQQFSDSLREIVIEEGNKFFEISDDALCCKSDGSLVYVPKDKSILYLPEYVTILKNGVLKNHNNLKKLVLSSNISDLGESPFWDDYNLSEVYCMNATPPSVRYLTNAWYGDKKIYIPVNSMSNYTDAGWDATILEERSFDYAITLSSSSMKLYNVIGGNERVLSAMIFTPAGPAQYVQSAIKWSSDNSSIVSVDSLGVIRYVSEGEAIVTGQVEFADTVISAECLVNNIKLDNRSDVYYVTAGNLSSLIDESKKYKITDLILLGEINADDVRFLREMAGIDNNHKKTDGILAHLNIEAVKVVSGGSYNSYYWGTEYCETNKLGPFAFADCCSLEDVILPSNLSELESGLFNECQKLKSVTLPSLISRIPSQTFYNCKSLTNVLIPENVKYINDNAFGYCTSLKSIIALGKSPSSLDWSSFSGLTKTNIALLIPDGARSAYSESDWRDFTNMAEMDKLPILLLGYNDLSLFNFKSAGASERTIPATVITKYGVTDVNVKWSSSNPEIVTVDNAGHVSMTAISGTSQITATANVEGETLVATCNVTTNVIDADNAYYVEAGNLPNLIPEEQKDSITKLVLFGELNGTDIRFIREMAGIPYNYWDNSYEQSGSLEYLDLSHASIVSGGSDYGMAEYQHSNANDWWGTNVYTENDVIGHGMFRKSRTLKQIILPANIKKIGTYAFYECSKLEESITIPSTVTELSARALYGFDVVYTSNEEPVTLQDPLLLSEGSVIVVPASKLETYKSADIWKEFKNQIIPDNISTTMSLEVTAEEKGSGLLTAAGSDEALSYIMNLTLSGTINSYDIHIIRNRMPVLRNLDLTNVKVIASPFPYYTDSYTENNRLGQNAFRELKNLRSIILPNTIDYIGCSTFYGCDNLRYVKMYKGVNTIDNNAFQDCHNLVEIELPEGLLGIGDNAFYYCYSLDEISIPSTVRNIGGSAFYDCYSLKSIVLPKNLAEIKSWTFSYCRSLETVILPVKANEIDYYAFYGCDHLKELRLPPMIERIGDRAFDGCNKLTDIYVYTANPKDIMIEMNTFSCGETALLHIPNFSYLAYYWDTQWGQFYNKIEFEDSYEEFYTKNTLFLDPETGIIDGDPDATLYERGGLVVDDVNQNLGEVELKSDGTDGASLIATGEGTIKASKLTVNINITGLRWHFFSFPFDVPLDSIHYTGEYVWRQYDGAARSRHEGGWQNLAAGTTVLSKGRGYIFQGTETGCLSFTIDNPDLTAKDEATGLYTHESNNAQDANWNFIGNPYTSYYNIDESAYSAPITVWTGYGYEAYRPGDDAYDFAPYQAFFVQNSDDSNAFDFSAQGRESYEDMNENKAARRAAARARTDNPSRLFINLEIFAQGDSTYTDKTRIVFNNNKSMDYEQSCDAAKFFSDSRPIELYSLDTKGVKYSINERPVENGAVDLGISVNIAGDYILDAVRMDTPVLLIDNELGIAHDLSNGPYSFSATKGEYSRFTIKLGLNITKVLEFMNTGSDSDSDSYDLQGRKIIDNDVKGVIIRDGKKIMGK